MCNRRSEPTVRERQLGQQESYTGQTISLGSVPGTTTRSRCSGKHHFPFWLLWLLWPLVGVAKAGLPWLAGALVMLAEWSVPFWPLLLIALGVFLLRRR